MPLVTDVPAIEAMYKALVATPAETAWLVTTGTMTNAGLLFALHPDLAGHIKGLSIMGGGVGNFFTHAPMGRFADRVMLSPKVWQQYPQGLPAMEPLKLLEDFLSKGLLLDVPNGLDKNELAKRLKRQQEACGNWSQFAEFNVSQSDLLTSRVLTVYYQIYV